jgi:DNA-binding NarL/FixJ family response regulator
LLGDTDVPVASDRLVLLRRIADAVTARSDGVPIVVVDDAHLLDDGSAAVIQHLVTGGHARAILTLRGDAVASDAIQVLWKDGYLERLELQPLGMYDVDALLSQVLGRAVDEVARERLLELSRGNVLLLKELVASALESGALVDDQSVWVWKDRFRPSTRLRELIATRVKSRGSAVFELIEYLAVGEPVTLPVATSMVSLDAVAQAEQAGLVIVHSDDDSPVVRCAHPLYQEVVLSEMGEGRRRVLLTALADQMSRMCARPADRLRVAAWQLDLGEKVDPVAMTDAAAIAMKLFDFDLAERLARRAVEAEGGLAAALMLGTSLNRLGRHDESESILAPLANAAITDRQRVEVAVERHVAATKRGVGREADSILTEAEQLVRDTHLRAFLVAQRATTRAFAGDLEQSAALAANATMAVANDDTTHEIAAIRAVVPLGAACTLDGRTEEAIRLARDQLEPAIRHADDLPIGVFWVVSTLLNALTVGGHLDEADELVERAEGALLSDIGFVEVTSFLAFAKGMTQVMRGRALTAQQLLAPIANHIATTEDSRVAPATRLSGAFLVEAYALTRDDANAEIASEQAHRAVHGFGAFEGVVRRSDIWQAVARGQLTRAVEVAVATAEWCRANGQHTVELFALHDAVRIGNAADVAERLRDLASTTDMRWAKLFAEHARAVVANDGPALETVARSFEQDGAYLRAAEAATHADVAYCHERLDARAARCRTRARLLLAACDGARPSYLANLDEPTPLTPREREVALLAARGLTSRVISDRLFLSTRTVEGHLQRVYNKLGVSNRAGLAQTLDDAGQE